MVSASLDNLAVAFERSTTAISFVSPSGMTTIRRADLFARAAQCAAAMSQKGVTSCNAIVLVGQSSEELIVRLLAAWILGCDSAFLPYPNSAKSDSGWWLLRWQEMLTQLSNPIAFVSEDVYPQFAQLGSSCQVLDIGSYGHAQPERFENRSVQHLQFTSGTTGMPGLVRVAHNQIAQNAQEVAQRMGVGRDDSVVSWLPLYHDMGFVGVLAFTAIWDVPLCLIPTEMFQRSPGIWINQLSQHQASISVAPPSAYALIARFLRGSRVAKFNLSNWRIGLVGAETIRATDAMLVQDWLQKNISGSTQLVPCYGMAEATLAVTMANPISPLREATRVPEDLGVVSSGIPLQSVKLQLQAISGFKQSGIGRILIRSPCVALPYDIDDWLDTGDYGFVEGGELYVMGRLKDTLIVAGVNHDPLWLESIAKQALDQAGGARIGRVAAVQNLEGEIGVLYESNQSVDRAEHLVRRSIMNVLGVKVDRVTNTPRNTLPTTTSGKLSRVKCRELLS